VTGVQTCALPISCFVRWFLKLDKGNAEPAAFEELSAD